MPAPGELADALERELAERGTPERAEKERSYLKSELAHVGASVPQVRAAATRLHRDHPDLGHEQLIAVAKALWETPVHERRLAAIELLDLRSGALTDQDLPLLERLLREARTWALVDPLAVNVVGALLDRLPAAVGARLDAWSDDSDLWVRRASLLAYLRGLRRGEGDFDGFAGKADRMLEERERFIRKAIGWVLRDTAKRRPDLVVAWLDPRAHRASGLTLREAVKYLPAADKERLILKGREPSG